MPPDLAALCSVATSPEVHRHEQTGLTRYVFLYPFRLLTFPALITVTTYNADAHWPSTHVAWQSQCLP